MKLIHPVYVDGPLAGLDHPIVADKATARSGIIVDIPASAGARPSAVQYHLHRLTVTLDGERFSFAVASSSLRPSAGSLLQHMFSDAARAALDEGAGP